MIVAHLVLLILAGQETTTSEPVRIRPQWAELPSAEALMNAAPPAFHDGVSGQTRIRCVVGLDGRLRDCVVTQEEPAGLGFGEAALRFSRSMRFTPGSLDGVPVDGMAVIIPTAWEAAD